MSVTGPGCAACDGGRVTTPEGDVRPCDRCGGWSQFAAPVAAASSLTPIERRDIALRLRREWPDAAPVPLPAGFADPDAPAQPDAASPETDWRPLPSCAEVLAHNDRTGGDCFGPWLCAPAEGRDVRVVWLGVAELPDDAAPDPRVEDRHGYPWDASSAPDARWRPITRRGEALPWPEIPR